MHKTRMAVVTMVLFLSLGVPFATVRTEPVAFQPPKLPEKPYSRIPAPDLTQPLLLPILATPAPDREPFTDVTIDSSRAAALSGPLPIRTSPAPFVRQRIPDPFEHQNTIRLRTPLPEDPYPPPTIVPPLTK